MKNYLYNNGLLKIYSLLLVLIIGMSNIACSSTKEGDQISLNSFSLWENETKVNGVIDEATGRIVISEVKEIADITRVSYDLSSGATIYPIPETRLNDWQKEERFVVSLSGKQSKVYTIYLPNAEKLIVNTLNVKVKQRQQQILFVGGDMERSQSFLQKAANPEEIAGWCFKDIRFEVCRVAYDKKQELIEGEKNPAFYAAAIKSMQQIKVVNPNIQFWATMKSDYNGYDGQNNLPDWICNYKPTNRFNTAKYALFLADYLEYMKNAGVEIKYLSTAKEWVDIINANRAKEIIIALNKECQKRGINQPLYVDPASWGITQGVNFIKATKAAGSTELYYGFTTHNLNGKESEGFLYEQFVAAAKSVGKFAFADETSSAGGGRTTGIEPETLESVLKGYREKCEFYKDGIQGELIFEIFSRGITQETRNVYFTPGATGKRMRSYYVLKEFANGIAGRDKYYVPTEHLNIAEEVYTMGFVNDKEFFFCVINATDQPIKDAIIQMEGSTTTGVAQQTIMDISQPIEGGKSEIEIKNGTMQTTLSPLSIIFFKTKL